MDAESAGLPDYGPLILLNGHFARIGRNGPGENPIVFILENRTFCIKCTRRPDCDSKEAAAVGVYLTSHTLPRAEKLRINPAQRLIGDDAQALFEQLGDCVRVGAVRSAGDVLRAILLAQE